MYSPDSFIALAIVLPLLGAAAVCVRFYVRWHVRSSHVGADDHMIVAGCLLVCAMGANQLLGTILGGLGRHTPTAANGSPIIDQRTKTLLKSIYAQDIIEKLAYGFIKLSVLFFYRRVFCTPRFVRTTDVVIALTAAWTASFFVVSVFVCGVHPDIQWTYTSAHEKKTQCADSSMVLLWFAITDVLGDILILFLPSRPVRILQKSAKEKACILGIFMLGALSTAAGIVRLGFVVRAFTQKYGESGDINGASSPPWMWTHIEASVGVIAACLPTMAPLIRSGPLNPAKLSSSLRKRVSYYTHASSQPIPSPSISHEMSDRMSSPSPSRSRSPNTGLQSLPSIAFSLSHGEDQVHTGRRHLGTASWAETSDSPHSPRNARINWGLWPKSLQAAPQTPTGLRSPAGREGLSDPNAERKLSVVDEVPVEPGLEKSREEGSKEMREVRGRQNRTDRSLMTKGALAVEREVSVTRESVGRLKSMKAGVNGNGKKSVRVSSCYSGRGDGTSFFSDEEDKEDV